jgi:hypothetical protein
MTARAITAPELAILRSEGQFSRLNLAIVNPSVVWVARVNGTPVSNDMVGFVPWIDATFGDVNSLQYGMTVLVGSSAGDGSKGEARFLSASGSIISGSTVVATNAINIGFTSEIAFADGDYLTAIDEYGLWPKQAIFAGGVFFCDNNTPYTNQHDPDALRPVPVLGPDIVLYMSGSSVSYTPDAGDSWVLSGSVVSYAWSFAPYVSGSPAISGSATATPTVTFYATGAYTIGCTVTTNNGISATGRRVVYVYSDLAPLVSQFSPESCQGDWKDGGWSFEATMYAQAEQATVRDRAKVFLLAHDFIATSGSGVSGSPVSIGPLAGYENIVATGWIAGETIQWNPELSTVKFAVRGPHWWLGHVASQQAGIVDTNETPTNWNFYQNLTYDAFLWHIITWRCTAGEVMDVYPSGDTRRIVGTTAAWGTIWAQLSQVGSTKFLIAPACNRFGQMYNQQDTNYLPAASRASVPTVMDVTKADWQDTIEIERRTVPEVAFMDCGGFSWDGASDTPSAFRSGAWGTAVGRHGRMDRRLENALTVAGGQAECNALAGILLGYENNKLPSIGLQLASFNRFFDICPNQYGQFSLAAGDTPRGITLTDQKFVPRSIAFVWDADTHAPYVEITAEGQSETPVGYYLPFYNGRLEFRIPEFPNFPWSPTQRAIRPGRNPGTCTAPSAPANGPYEMFFSTTLSDEGDLSASKPFRCKIRAGDADNPSFMTLRCTTYTSQSISEPYTWYEEPNGDTFTVDALDTNGNVVASGSVVPYTGPAQGDRIINFGPVDASEVWAFRVTIPGYSGSGLQPGEVIATGNVGDNPYSAVGFAYEGVPSLVLKTATRELQDYATPIPGQIYYIESSGGPSPVSGSYVGGAPKLFSSSYQIGVVAGVKGEPDLWAGLALDYQAYSGSYVGVWRKTADISLPDWAVQIDDLDPYTRLYFRYPDELDLRVHAYNEVRLYTAPSTSTVFDYYLGADLNFTYGYATTGGVPRRLVIEGASMSNVCEYYDE